MVDGLLKFRTLTLAKKCCRGLDFLYFGDKVSQKFNFSFPFPKSLSLLDPFIEARALTGDVNLCKPDFIDI